MMSICHFPFKSEKWIVPSVVIYQRSCQYMSVVSAVAMIINQVKANVLKRVIDIYLHNDKKYALRNLQSCHWAFYLCELKSWFHRQRKVSNNGEKCRFNKYYGKI